MTASDLVASTRLTFRIHRFEVVLVLGATLLSVLVSAVVLTWMTANDYGACLSDDGSQPFRSVCLGSVSVWVNRIVRLSIGIVPVFPFLAGILIGPALVGRELDSGTARLAWSLGPSRLRWFLQRAVPALILVAVCGFAIGVVSDALQSAISPGADLSRSFLGYRTRGVIVGAEALLVAAVGLFAGALLGRPVPALIIALVLGGGLFLAADRIDRTLLLPEAEIRAECCDNSQLWLDGKYQMPDGRLLTYEQVVAEDPNAEMYGPAEPYVALVIPGERYRSIEARNAIALSVIALVFVVVAALVVQRRRPR